MLPQNLVNQPLTLRDFMNFNILLHILYRVIRGMFEDLQVGFPIVYGLWQFFFSVLL